MESTQTRERRGGIVFPIILIGAGLVFLLTNLGLVDASVWGTLLQLWPILLIAVGLDILIGRRSIWGSLLIVVLLFGVLGAVILADRTGTTISSEQLASDQVNQPLNGLSRGDVEISPGVAQLRIAAASEGGALVSGQVSHAQGERIDQSARNIGDTLRYTLRSQSAPLWVPGLPGAQGWQDRIWDLQLSRDVPLTLRVNSGIGTSGVDLSRLQVTNLDYNGGVGVTQLTLPRTGQVRATVDAGVGQVLITVPAGVAASIQVDGGLGSTEVKGNYRQQGDHYVSPNYNSAANRVDLTVKGGIGRVSVQEEAGG